VISFDAAHRAIHYPPDRRFRVWIKPAFIAVASCLVLLPLLLAWGQAALFGLPSIPPIPQLDEHRRPDHMAFRCGYATVISLILSS